MATRTRATTTSNVPMKEKRGISPSNTGTTPRKTAQKNNSPAKSHDPAATNSSGKPVPNYLKATLSSGLDKTKAFSSVSTSDASNKLATVNRRRSFDKPQPPYNSQSQQLRSRVSPNPMSRSSSSSSSGKISSASSQKTGSEKGLVRGTAKDGVVKQQHGLYAKSSMGCSNNAKKSTTAVYAKKQVIGMSNGPSMMKEEEVVVSPIEKAEDHNVSDDVAEAEVVEHEAVQESKAENGNENEDDLIESEEVGAIDHESEVIESDKDAQIIVTTAESSSSVTEQQHDRDDESVGVKSDEEADQVTHQDDSKEEIIIKEVNDFNNDSNNHENEIVAADNINDRSDDVDENDEKEESSRNESNETANASEASRDEAKETETDDRVKEEVAAEKKPEKYQGKRESAVSNDVIEETASKLREQRKNKVKALAGAFETVISLQDSK